MKENEIIEMQNRQWRENRKLFIVLVGSRWKAYNQSARVISSITGYRIRRKTIKSVDIDLVSFPNKGLKKVRDKLSSAYCTNELFDNDDSIKEGDMVTYVAYVWREDIPEVVIYHPVKNKTGRQEFRSDSETEKRLKEIQANGGFGGRQKATASEILRYAIKHFYDT